VVIEDAPAGIRAGKASNARVIALQTTERDALLREAGADWIVKDCASVHAGRAGSDGKISLLLSNSQ
jgi:glycerol 3-phosphatase-1